MRVKFLWFLFLVLALVNVSVAGEVGSGTASQLFSNVGSEFLNIMKTAVFGGIGKTAILIASAVIGGMAFFMQKWPMFIFLMIGLGFYLLLPTIIGGIDTAVGMIL